MLSHTATAEWQSFESRMRRRRAERLTVRAEAAASAGFEDEARACLAEARTLVPDLPEIAAVEAALARHSEPIVIAEAPLLAAEPDPPARFALIACVTACILVAAFLGGWLAYRDVPHITEALPTKVEAAARPVASPAPPLSVPGSVPGPLPIATVGAGTPLAAQDRPSESAVATPPSLGTTEGLPTLPDPAPAPPAPIPAAPVEPPPFVTPPAAPSAGLAGTILPPPSVDVTAPVVEPSQEPLVRAVLNRYAAAYTSLDADAAVLVWPTVNRGALARAFDGLAAQSVNLGDCRIDVMENKARARCTGQAAWSPKVGSGTHTESRVWTFDLARVGAGWQILNARAQNR